MCEPKCLIPIASTHSRRAFRTPRLGEGPRKLLHLILPPLLEALLHPARVSPGQAPGSRGSRLQGPRMFSGAKGCGENEKGGPKGSQAAALPIGNQSSNTKTGASMGTRTENRQVCPKLGPLFGFLVTVILHQAKQGSHFRPARRQHSLTALKLAPRDSPTHQPPKGSLIRKAQKEEQQVSKSGAPLANINTVTT